MALVYGQDQRVTEWVARQMGDLNHRQPKTSIGYEIDGELVAAVLFENATSTNVFAHIASTAKVMPKSLLRAVAAYAFVQCRVRRMTFLVHDNNSDCLRFVLSLGAKPEAVIREGHAAGDTIVFALWNDSRFFRRLISSKRLDFPEAKHG